MLESVSWWLGRKWVLEAYLFKSGDVFMLVVGSRIIVKYRAIIFIEVASDGWAHQSTNIRGQRLDPWKFLIEIGIRIWV